MTIERYPLTWPPGRPRTVGRRDSKFELALGESMRRALNELKLLGARDVIISSNIPTRLDGLPYATTSEPNDPGIAVYFNRRVKGATKPYVIACDTYRRVRENMRAIAMTIEALRTIERHGAETMLEQAFTGFAALPPANASRPWWEVLGVPTNATESQVQDAYRVLARIHHPDVAGGSLDRMSEINVAYEQAKKAWA
jgi:hypothetical protein